MLEEARNTSVFGVVPPLQQIPDGLHGVARSMIWLQQRTEELLALPQAGLRVSERPHANTVQKKKPAVPAAGDGQGEGDGDADADGDGNGDGDGDPGVDTPMADADLNRFARFAYYGRWREVYGPALQKAERFAQAAHQDWAPAFSYIAKLWEETTACCCLVLGYRPPLPPGATVAERRARLQEKPHALSVAELRALRNSGRAASWAMKSLLILAGADCSRQPPALPKRQRRAAEPAPGTAPASKRRRHSEGGSSQPSQGTPAPAAAAAAPAGEADLHPIRRALQRWQTTAWLHIMWYHTAVYCEVWGNLRPHGMWGFEGRHRQLKRDARFTVSGIRRHRTGVPELPNSLRPSQGSVQQRTSCPRRRQGCGVHAGVSATSARVSSDHDQDCGLLCAACCYRRLNPWCQRRTHRVGSLPAWLHGLHGLLPEHAMGLTRHPSQWR